MITKEEAHELYISYRQQVEEFGWKLLDTIAQDPVAGRKTREEFDNFFTTINHDKRLHPFQINHIFYDVYTKFVHSDTAWKYGMKYDYYDLRDEVEARRDYLKLRGIEVETYETVAY
jgi:hypothetical protein